MGGWEQPEWSPGRRPRDPRVTLALPFHFSRQGLFFAASYLSITFCTASVVEIRGCISVACRGHSLFLLQRLSAIFIVAARNSIFLQGHSLSHTWCSPHSYSLKMSASKCWQCKRKVELSEKHFLFLFRCCHDCLHSGCRWAGWTDQKHEMLFSQPEI